MKTNMDIPSRPEDISREWLNHVLSGHLQGHSVTACKAAYSSEPGQTAEVLDIQLEYSDAACPLPGRMIAKITSHNPELSELLNGMGFYAREAQFYKHFADTGIRTADCYFSEYDAESQRMIILMEHLAPSRSPSWGISLEQVRYACRVLPAFHAKWWNDENLKSMPFLNQMPSEDFLKPMIDLAHSAADKVAEVFGNEADTSIRCLDAFARNYDQVTSWISNRPFTLVHGDYHAKQLFFPTAAGGHFAVIDWQYPFVAQGAWDLVRILSLCVDTSTRREQQEAFLAGYHRGLAEHGVTNYTRDDLDMDLKIGAIYGQALMSAVVQAGDLEQAERECTPFGIDWREVYFLRSDRFLRDLNALEFISSLTT
jgi:hypothetical protein